LVHFVDSAKVALGCSEEDSTAEDLDQAFCHLEHSLRSFVLVNRAKSKLGPAQNYVTHLLADVELLASANSLVAAQEIEIARAELERVRPVLEQMKKGKEGLEESLVAEEESATEQASARTRQAMIRGLERVGQGELAAPAPGLELPNYPGLLGVWDYAREVKRVLLASVDFVSALAEQDARKLTSDGVSRVAEIGDKYLPEDVERSKRVFNPSAMFSVRPPSKLARRASGVNTLGLGLASRPQLADVSLIDIFDFTHHLSLARKSLPSSLQNTKSSSSTSTDLIPSFGAEVGGLGIASLAVGMFTMSGKAFGVSTLLDSALRVSDLIAHPLTRKWIGPVVGVFAVGAVGYIVYELPRSIPRNIGRHLQLTLTNLETSDEGMAAGGYPDIQAQRISKEVRKVMRLAAWDLRERFKGAVDARGEVVRQSEEVERKAKRAGTYFREVEKKVEEIREQVAGKV